MSRKWRYHAVLCAMVIGVFPVAYAQDNNQFVSGVVQQGFGANQGTDAVGAYFAGKSNGDFSATDSKNAFGTVTVFGTGTGAQSVQGNSAASNSNSLAQTNNQAIGDTNTSMNIFGLADQANWAHTGSGDNFAGAFNETQGIYNGSKQDVAPATADGTGNASGNTMGTVNFTPTAANSAATSQGQSSGVSHFFGNTGQPTTGTSVNSNANGHGNAGVGTIIGGGQSDNFVAGSSGAGWANYDTRGAVPSATGSLTINGTTNNKFDGTVVSSGATMTSLAVGNGGNPTPPTCCGH